MSPNYCKHPGRRTREVTHHWTSLHFKWSTWKTESPLIKVAHLFFCCGCYLCWKHPTTSTSRLQKEFISKRRQTKARGYQNKLATDPSSCWGCTKEKKRTRTGKDNTQPWTLPVCQRKELLKKEKERNQTTWTMFRGQRDSFSKSTWIHSDLVFSPCVV